MFEKYAYTLADVINGKQVGDGKAGFRKAFHECTENAMREKNQMPKAHQVVRASGVVGVQPDEYEPALDQASRLEQEGIRSHLQNLHHADPDDWAWENIHQDMMESYILQRHDIVKAKEAVTTYENHEEQGENIDPDEDPDEPSVKALQRVKELWPYLFRPQGLRDHHNRLTKRDLKPHLDEFLESKLDHILVYLTSSSKSNQKNVALTMRLDRVVKEWTPPKKFLKMILMLANHFGERKNILLHAVEVRRKSAYIHLLGKIKLPSNCAHYSFGLLYVTENNTSFRS